MKERELLENPQEGIVGAIPRDVESQAAPARQPQQNRNSLSGAGQPWPQGHPCHHTRGNDDGAKHKDDMTRSAYHKSGTAGVPECQPKCHADGVTQRGAEDLFTHAGCWHAGTGASVAANSNGHAEEVGHNVDVPAEVLLDGEHVMSDRYAEVTGLSPATSLLPSFPPSSLCALHMARGTALTFYMSCHSERDRDQFPK